MSPPPPAIESTKAARKPAEHRKIILRSKEISPIKIYFHPMIIAWRAHVRNDIIRLDEMEVQNDVR